MVSTLGPWFRDLTHANFLRTICSRTSRKDCAPFWRSRTLDVLNFANRVVCRREHIIGDVLLVMPNRPLRYLGREHTR